jgi:hypothetical protein
MVGPLFVVSFAALFMCAAEPKSEMTLRLQVPANVASRANARASGDASAPTPVLMLEDVELIVGERVTIDVLGPADEQSGERPFLGSAATVGQEPTNPPRTELMTLVVPLNDIGAQLVAGKKEIALTLRLRGDAKRAPLKLKRAYFHAGEGN